MSSYEQLIENSKAFSDSVAANRTLYSEEDLATLHSMGESWTFVSQVNNIVRLKNSAGEVYEFDVKTRHFTLIISDKEKEEIEKSWPKVKE